MSANVDERSESDTPRTDAAQTWIETKVIYVAEAAPGESCLQEEKTEWVSADFARQLERELAMALESLRRISVGFSPEASCAVDALCEIGDTRHNYDEGPR